MNTINSVESKETQSRIIDQGVRNFHPGPEMEAAKTKIRQFAAQKEIKIPDDFDVVLESFGCEPAIMAKRPGEGSPINMDLLRQIYKEGIFKKLPVVTLVKENDDLYLIDGEKKYIFEWNGDISDSESGEKIDFELRDNLISHLRREVRRYQMEMKDPRTLEWRPIEALQVATGELIIDPKEDRRLYYTVNPRNLSKTDEMEMGGKGIDYKLGDITPVCRFKSETFDDNNNPNTVKGKISEAINRQLP